MRGIRAGEVWMIDFGMADLVTVLLHTTSFRGDRWELNISKPFLKAGAFHLQQVQTISTVKLQRRLGVLTLEEMTQVHSALRNRLGMEASAH